MPRYIDADALRKEFSERPPDYYSTGYILDTIDELPALSTDEVRGVVHCSECSHADKDLPGAIYCTMWDAWEAPEDGFCHKGARMEETE